MDSSGLKPIGDVLDMFCSLGVFVGRALVAIAILVVLLLVFCAGYISGKSSRDVRSERQEVIESLTPEQRKVLGL